MRPMRIGAGTVKALAAATVVFAALLPVQPAYAATTNFYVDPVNGSDGNSGTSTGAAFKTIQAAETAVRAANANMTDDIVVNLRGGTYPSPPRSASAPVTRAPTATRSSTRRTTVRRP